MITVQSFMFLNSHKSALPKWQRVYEDDVNVLPVEKDGNIKT